MIFRILFIFLAFMVTNSIAFTVQQTYIVHMDETEILASIHSLDSTKPWFESVIDFIAEATMEEDEQEETLAPQLLYAYETSMFGFAASLSEKQLKYLNQVDGFLTAIPDELLTLHTTYTSHFLGLKNGIGLWSAPNLASDVIIGVLDSGIWPEHIIAASYTDRTFPTKVELGNRKIFTGSSLYKGKQTNQLPLVYGKSAGTKREAQFCTKGSLDSKLVHRKIVACERGLNGRTEKGEAVKIAGGAGMILLNSKSQGQELFADPHILPATSIGASESDIIRTYINSSKTPTASISFIGTKYGDPAPIIAAFSSRGPSIAGPDVIKPDITAPGVNILAAWPSKTSPSMLKSDQRSVVFNIISGTSMSCPHVSGIAALLKSMHKDWSPASIKSALMTTAYTFNNKGTPITDIGSNNSFANPFAFGSGHVKPESASDPGLVYDISTKDYLNYLCSLNYTSSQIGLLSKSNFACPKKPAFQVGELNYPSFSVLLGKGSVNASVTYKRVVTNVGKPQSNYVVKVEQPNGVSVSVVPRNLKFEKMGQKLSYHVTFFAFGRARVSGVSSFGSLIWVSEKYKVQSPIAVTWQ
ncbi:putative tripeptidyl-peptidase II [Lupinus albus]|uniref:Putative tripeptidyl-peptidase II n=1 Tax=Lupinus albus TaxID=3870 RepID=A0A6A4P0V6_LUPAL|nr:putative tripeptidyl-peptidase II [Lupinus albus]